MDEVRRPDDPTVVRPLLLWCAALDSDLWVLWLWHHRRDLAVLYRDDWVRG